MSRRQAQAGLDATVDRSRITLLHGLPRVGLSLLLADLRRRRSSSSKQGVQSIRYRRTAKLGVLGRQVEHDQRVAPHVEVGTGDKRIPKRVGGGVRLKDVE